MRQVITSKTQKDKAADEGDITVKRINSDSKLFPTKSWLSFLDIEVMKVGWRPQKLTKNKHIVELLG